MGDITLKAMPFDSNEILNPATGETTFDRVAYSRDLADWLRTYISNGILVQGGDVLGSQLKVLHKEALTCTVKAGAVCINGRTGWLEADTDITVEMGGAQPRVDRVVAELNIPNDRGIYIKTLKGAPAAEPVPPNLTQTEDVYQIPLAQVRVNSGQAIIYGVTDERPSYISNVTIGIKPPTGNEAVTVTLGSENVLLYGVGNVDQALEKSPNIFERSSYSGFCANVNTNSLDCAFGKNNEEYIYGLGNQLAMYAWFKGDSKIEYPFVYLSKMNNFSQILNNPNAYAEALLNENTYNLIQLSPYAKSLFEVDKVVKNITCISAGLNNSDYSTCLDIISSQSAMGAVYNSRLAMLALLSMDANLNAFKNNVGELKRCFANQSAVNTLLASKKIIQGIDGNGNCITAANTSPLREQKVVAMSSLLGVTQFKRGFLLTATSPEGGGGSSHWSSISTGIAPPPSISGPASSNKFAFTGLRGMKDLTLSSSYVYGDVTIAYIRATE